MRDFAEAINEFMTTTLPGQALALSVFAGVVLFHLYSYYAGLRDLRRWVYRWMGKAERADRKKIRAISGLIFIPFMLLWFAPAVFADAPVVCESGSGDTTWNNYDLAAQCGAPVARPVYVELHMVSGGGVFNSSRVQLTEGAQSCDISTPLVADCAVTVRDGILDFAGVSNNPQNYRLSLRWDVEAASSSLVTDTNTFTIPLSSGDTAIIRREFDYGDIALGGMLFFGLSILLVGLITRYITGR